MDRAFLDAPATAGEDPGPRATRACRWVTLAAGILYIHTAPFGSPFLEAITLLTAVAVAVSVLGLLTSKLRPSPAQAPYGHFYLIFGFCLFVSLVVAPTIDRLIMAPWIADEIDGTVTRKYRETGNHALPVVDVGSPDGAAHRHRVVESTWEELAAGDRVAKRRGSTEASVNGKTRTWAPPQGLRGVDPYPRWRFVSLLFVSSCLALLWVAGSFSWRWLRRTGPLRLAGEATALAEGTIVGFGRPELDEEVQRAEPWKEPRGRYRWRYEFEVIDPSGQRRTYGGGEPVSRRFPADDQAAMTVGHRAKIRYAVADPTRSELLRIL